MELNGQSFEFEKFYYLYDTVGAQEGAIDSVSIRIRNE